ncbi:hypothetical protein IEO21_10545 [Rhodonia placenta]|uniref:Uncharacterized protein n=1 Tax=Rhodonia placenta TaxID=104341 RepID=A0A8H7NSB1_9APHY|nr:hypothetical protein IEO21_10545 [Postia placenta]
MKTSAQCCKCTGPLSQLPPEESKCPLLPQCRCLWRFQLPANAFAAD